MRLWRYLDTNGALLTIEGQALRVSRLHELNDPLEWKLGISNLVPEGEEIAEAQVDRVLRHISSVAGIICFSRSPDEPVLWSHYADRHRGIALEIDVADDPTRTILMKYTDVRPYVDINKIHDPAHMRPIVERLIFQKSEGWSYEREYRIYEDLAGCQARGGHYFKSLDPVDLKRVIIGWRSSCDVQYVRRALELGGYPDTPVVRARAQPHSYKLYVDGYSSAEAPS